jgi:hypothetical protein
MRTRALPSRLAIGPLLIATCLAFASAARAQTEQDDRAQFHSGVEAAQNGQWEDARQAFARAYEINPRPVTLLNLAGAQARTGRLLAATESYRRFLTDATAPELAGYRDAAERALHEVEGRTPRARVMLSNVRPGDLLRFDNGSDVPATSANSVSLDPGDHAVALTRDHVTIATARFALRESEDREIPLRAPESAVTTVAARSAVLPSTPHPAPTTSRQHSVHRSAGVFASPWFWTVASVVVVGAATTAIVVAATSAEPFTPFEGNIAPGRLGTH